MLIKNSKQPLTQEEIEKVENRLGFKLPRDYRDFLIENNGGVPDVDTYSFYDTENKLSGSVVDYFHSIFEGNGAGNLELKYKYLKDSKRIPPNILPIASDPGGIFVCISVFGDDIGKVYFWDHEIEPQDASYENVSLIAETFNEFINKLQ